MSLSRRSNLYPLIFVAAMAVVVLVNAGMVTAALTTFSGVAHDNAFGRGLAYNQVLAEVERQERLGWQATVTLGTARADGVRSVSVALVDAQGRALSDGVATARFVRPVEKGVPVDAALVETVPGRYEGETALPARGQWDLRIAIVRAGERADLTKRIFVK